MTHATRNALGATCALLMLAGCASTTPAPKAMKAASGAKEAVAVLAPASGSLVSGRLTLMPMGDGVHITGEIGGLRPGDVRGFHVHEKGDCSAADASSAGGHFNPGGSAHGRAGQGVHHAGDADNLVADAKGVVRVNAHLRGLALGSGGGSDIAGRALIVHAAADDYATQPTGNAGARVACGVVRITR